MRLCLVFAVALALVPLAAADGGLTWAFAGTGPGAGIPPCDSAAIDPAVPSTVYVATARRVFRSTGSGVTWHPLRNGLDQVTITGLVIDPIDSSILYAGTRGDGVMMIKQE